MGTERVLTSCENPETAIIWLHGLGSSGADFLDFVHLLDIPGGIRLTLPDAPERPVTMNDGMVMPAWFDIIEASRDAPFDKKNLYKACDYVHGLIDSQRSRGFAPDSIVVGGFSQGGILALCSALSYRKDLMAAIGLSCYLHKKASQFPPGQPLLMCHGKHDSLLDVKHAEATVQELLEHNHSVDWHVFDMEHTICDEEIQLVRQWLEKQLRSKE